LLRNTLFDGDVGKLAEKARVPDRAAIFAISDSLKAEVLLQLNRSANRAIFHFTQHRGRKLTFLMLLASAQKFRRPQQAADMIGAKRRKLFAKKSPRRLKARLQIVGESS